MTLLQEIERSIEPFWNENEDYGANRDKFLLWCQVYAAVFDIIGYQITQVFTGGSRNFVDLDIMTRSWVSGLNRSSTVRLRLYCAATTTQIHIDESSLPS